MKLKLLGVDEVKEKGGGGGGEGEEEKKKGERRGKGGEREGAGEDMIFPFYSYSLTFVCGLPQWLTR